MMADRDVDGLACAAAKGGRTAANAHYRWTEAMKTRFLDHLAATCNISASAQSIGVSQVAAQGLRRRDAAFARAWGMALEAGYQVLETHLVGIALAKSGAVMVVDDGVVADDGDGDGDGVSGAGGDLGPGAGAAASGVTAAPGVEDFEAGLRMLRHRATERARGWRGGSPPLGISTRKDTDAEILKKLAALAARRSST